LVGDFQALIVLAKQRPKIKVDRCTIISWESHADDK